MRFRNLPYPFYIDMCVGVPATTLAGILLWLLSIYDVTSAESAGLVPQPMSPVHSDQVGVAATSMQLRVDWAAGSAGEGELRRAASFSLIEILARGCAAFVVAAAWSAAVSAAAVSCSAAGVAMPCMHAWYSPFTCTVSDFVSRAACSTRSPGSHSESQAAIWLRRLIFGTTVGTMVARVIGEVGLLRNHFSIADRS